jgi:hypothetical protein
MDAFLGLVQTLTNPTVVPQRRVARTSTRACNTFFVLTSVSVYDAARQQGLDYTARNSQQFYYDVFECYRVSQERRQDSARLHAATVMLLQFQSKKRVVAKKSVALYGIVSNRLFQDGIGPHTVSDWWLAG